MKEETKYNQFRFKGKITVDEIQPWFDFDRSEPWDEREVPWPLENKVRRQILIQLAQKGTMTFEEIYNEINFSPSPLVITKEEYSPNVKYQWTKETLENHLLNLEWYSLIKREDHVYSTTFPVLNVQNLNEIDKYVDLLAGKWSDMIKEEKEAIERELMKYDSSNASIYEILLERVLEKLHLLLKEKGILPSEPNLKALWAEQLRDIRFQDWIKKNF
ncbi:MAG: hypothetical protein BAJALOKI2v1_560018 [Promethearchaeota archaeon]|nr:MAG: hypothetical protein BAJALOKI2v1_560018 [Candidatus Lokiarchaeota archaeon]